MAEIIDISDLNETASSNFGGGMELLMNKSHTSKMGGGSTNIGLSDLDDLENELNDLGNVHGTSDSGGFGKPTGVSFQPSRDDMDDMGSVHLNIHEDNDLPIDLGASTSNINTDKTWDDYGKYNEIPGYNGGSNSYGSSGAGAGAGAGAGPRLTKDEQDKEKYKMIREMEDWERKSNGKIQLSKKYTMESPFHEVKIEYDALKEDAGKKASVKFQGSCMKMLINGIEFLNDKFDPFDVNLEGWGDKVDDEMDQYDDIFGQLYDKYQHRGSIAPELKLMFQLGGSAFMVNLSNKIFKTAAPGMDDVFRQNPELMRSFQNAAINTMGQNNPGVGNFMSGLGSNNGQNQQQQQQGNRPNGGPPPPMPTQGQYADPPPQNRGGNNTRPDLAAARGVQARESGPLQARGDHPLQARDPYLPNQQQAPSRTPGPRNVPAAQQHASNNSAMNLALGPQPAQGAPFQPERSARRPATNRPDTEGRMRAEMKGPSDMSDLLSGIKTRTIEKPLVTMSTAPMAPAPMSTAPLATMSTAPMATMSTAPLVTMSTAPNSIMHDDNVSQMSAETMSVAPSVGGTKKPRKPRKSKSDKNTVSMDL